MDADEVGAAADGDAEGVQERLEMRGCHCFEEGEDGGEAEWCEASLKSYGDALDARWGEVEGSPLVGGWVGCRGGLKDASGGIRCVQFFC